MKERFQEDAMFIPGTPIQMTKGYKGVSGVIAAETDSPFELYLLKLENGIRLVAGPSAFEVELRLPLSP
jgi:hypothetical protein